MKRHSIFWFYYVNPNPFSTDDKSNILFIYLFIYFNREKMVTSILSEEIEIVIFFGIVQPHRAVFPSHCHGGSVHPSQLQTVLSPA